MNLYVMKQANYNARIIIKIIILLLILFGILMYIITFSLVTINHISPRYELYTRIINSNNNNNDNNNSSNYYKNDDENININNNDKDDSYFVNTVGCKMPSLPIINDNIKKYIRLAKLHDCGTKLIFSNNTHLWIDHYNYINTIYNITITDTDLLTCYYEPLIRVTDFTNNLTNYQELIEINKFYKITNEFVKVYCDYDYYKDLYVDYHFFVQPLHSDNNNNNNNNNNKMNVILFGLDSLSRLNLHRQMNTTVNLLLNKLNGIELHGYNKVADNTYPNLIPVLAGLDLFEFENSCVEHPKRTFDKCNIIWNKYKLKNYTTMFAEDIGYLGLFNYGKKGFEKPPTNYYTRPIIIEMEKHLKRQPEINIYHCIGCQTPIDILLDHTNKFLTNNKNEQKFGFFWSSSITHDCINVPPEFDIKIADFIENLNTNNFLNNTVLFFMSDHGMRWGYFRNTYQGMMEERQPILITIFPEWFKQKYKLAINNFERNIHRLTTHFDLYETLNDLTDLNNLLADDIKSRTKELYETSPLPRGISLFLPIPLIRTCQLAGIADHWCTCFERQKLFNKDIRVQNVAHFVVKELNEILKNYHQCQKLYLNTIKDANMEIFNSELTNQKVITHFYDITIRLQTKPGYGEFEATVRLDSNNNSTQLTGTISRTNLYGNQSKCVDNYQMKLYCFCGR